MYASILYRWVIKIFVKTGDKVEKGDVLTDGSINPHQLFELKGREAVQRYILQEVQGIYSSQGQKVNDKHVELVIRQMFSRVYIEDAGDTDLLPGEVVEKSQLDVSNRQAKKRRQQAGHWPRIVLGYQQGSRSPHKVSYPRLHSKKQPACWLTLPSPARLTTWKVWKKMLLSADSFRLEPGLNK